VTTVPSHSDARVVPHFEFTDAWASYEMADTWYPSWALDDNLYSPYTDGIAGGVPVMSSKPVAYTGAAIIRGNDPLRLSIEVRERHGRECERYDGNYPCGSLVHDGIWYYGTYYVQHRVTQDGTRITFEMGPVSGFRYSEDFGETWVASKLDDEQPLFPERGRPSCEMPIRFGAPKFVDFGRNLEFAPGGLAYLVGHGSSVPTGTSNWCAGDEVVLARVRPSPATINDLESYEFFAGLDQYNNPIWSGRFSQLQPIYSAAGAAGLPAITFNAGLQKYMLCVCAAPLHGGAGVYDTHILLGEHVWGPWEPLVELKAFGSQGYFVNIPSKFLSADGTTGWLWWSANWFNNISPTADIVERPLGSRYALCVRQFCLR
jgi:hypothetical protein